MIITTFLIKKQSLVKLYSIREPQDHYSEAHVVWEISRTVLLPLRRE
jgi:hypothetical protein